MFKPEKYTNLLKVLLHFIGHLFLFFSLLTCSTESEGEEGSKTFKNFLKTCRQPLLHS